MTCEDYQENISLFVDNELRERGIPELFSHVGGCSACQQFFSSVTRLRNAMNSAPGLAAPTTLDDRVQDISTEVAHQPKRRPYRLRWLFGKRVSMPAAAAGVALLVIFIGTFLLSFALLQWFNIAGSSKVEVVYIMGYPPVEVQAY